uniref:(California timema) hypothetical protein n=1 Tax=Timema californicum TaxID=61474 RepID=A0A7R9PA94_TIMCA|nr:unnamed protein product [Timema californicum]
MIYGRNLTGMKQDGVGTHVVCIYDHYSNYSSPVASLVLTDSSQLTSDSQHLGYESHVLGKHSHGTSHNFVVQTKCIMGPRLYWLVIHIGTDNHLTRKTPAAYADGVYMMAGQNRPSPRKLSQIFMKGQDGLGSSRNRTAMLAFFGM